MPRYDRTGPEGKGPLTGRGLGKCDVSKIIDEKKKTDIADKIIKKII